MNKKIVVSIIWLIGFFGLSSFLCYNYYIGNVYSEAETVGWFQLIRNIPYGDFFNSIRLNQFYLFHFPLFLLIYSLLYQISSNIYFIFTVHCFIISLGFLALFYLTSQFLKSFISRLFFSVLYFIFPLTILNTYANLSPLSHIMPVLFILISLLINKKNNLLILIVSIIFLSIREDAAFSLFLLGFITVFYIKSKRKTGIILCILSVIYFAVYNILINFVFFEPSLIDSVSARNIIDIFSFIPNFKYYDLKYYIIYLPFIFCMFSKQFRLLSLLLIVISVMHGIQIKFSLLRLHLNHIYPFLILFTLIGIKNLTDKLRSALSYSDKPIFPQDNETGLLVYENSLIERRVKLNKTIILSGILLFLFITLLAGIYVNRNIFFKYHNFNPDEVHLPEIDNATAVRATNYLLSRYYKNDNVFFITRNLDETRDTLFDKVILCDFNDKRLTVENKNKICYAIVSSVFAQKYKLFYCEKNIVGITNVNHYKNNNEYLKCIYNNIVLNKTKTFFRINIFYTISENKPDIFDIIAGVKEGNSFNLFYSFDKLIWHKITNQSMPAFSAYVPIRLNKNKRIYFKLIDKNSSVVIKTIDLNKKNKNQASEKNFKIINYSEVVRSKNKDKIKIPFTIISDKRFKVCYFINKISVPQYPYYLNERLKYHTAKYCGADKVLPGNWMIDKKNLSYRNNIIDMLLINEDGEYDAFHFKINCY